MTKIIYILLFFTLLLFNGRTIYSNVDTQKISVKLVQNKIKIGNLTGNKSLKFGVKNIAQEVISTFDNYQLVEYNDADNVNVINISIDIVFFDVMDDEMSVGIFHSGEESIIIEMIGSIVVNDSLIKVSKAESSSVDVNMSAFIDENEDEIEIKDVLEKNKSIRTAIKKVTENLINKLLTEK